MAKTWNEVASSAAYKALSPEDKELARTQYFDDVVAPKVSEEDYSAAKAQFDADTGQVKEKTKSYKDIPVDAAKAVGRGVSNLAKDVGSGLKTLVTDPGQAWRNYRDRVGGATIAAGEGAIRTGQAVKEDPLGTGELLLRSTADLPMGAVQAAVDTAGEYGLDRGGGKLLSESIGRVAAETQRQADEKGAAGGFVRGAIQGLEIPVGGPVWVKEGMGIVNKTLQGTATGAIAGGVQGALSPRSEVDLEKRQAARGQGLKSGVGYGAGAGAATELLFPLAKAVRAKSTTKGAEKAVAEELQGKFNNPKYESKLNAKQASDELAATIKAEEAFNKANNTNVNLNTSAALEGSPILDRYNQSVNKYGTDILSDESSVARAASLENRARENEAGIKDFINKSKPSELSSSNLEKASKEYLDTAVGKANIDPITGTNIAAGDVSKSNITANKEFGDYIKGIFSKFHEKTKEAYNAVSGVNAQATPVIQSLKAAAKDKAINNSLRTGNSLNKLLDAKNPSQITGIEDVVQAKRELSALINKADNAGNGTEKQLLISLKQKVEDFLDNHPNPEIRQANIDADTLWKDYQETLRRGGFDEPGVGNLTDRTLRSKNTVVNESQLRGNYIKEGPDAPIETVGDLQRLTKRAEDILGVKDEFKSKESQYLLSDLNTTLKADSSDTAVDTWFKKHSATFEANPDLKDKFKIVANNLDPITGKVARNFSVKDSYKSAKSTFTDATQAQSLANLVKGKPEAAKEAQDMFKTYLYDTTFTEKGVRNIDKLNKYFTDGTVENGIAKTIFKDNPTAYNNYKVATELANKMRSDRTLAIGSGASNLTAQHTAENTAEAIVSMTTPVTLGEGNRIFRFLSNLTNSKQRAVVAKMTTDKEYAKKLLDMDTSPDETEQLLKEVFVGLPSEKAGVRGAVVYGVTPQASEGDKYVPPAKTANDVALEEKKLKQKSQPVESIKDKRVENFKSNPIKYKVASTISKKAANLPPVVQEAALNIANSESEMGVKPRPKDNNTTAKGVFHILDGTAKDIAKELKRDKYDMMNNEDNVDFGLHYINKNYEAYKKAYKTEPKAWELKAMHVLGTDGFKQLKSKESMRVAVTTLPEFKQAALKNKSIFLSKDKTKSLTPKQVLAKLKELYENSET